jgi:hypothetical protein
LKEFGRLGEAHSRARDALYIIGNKDELEKNQKSDSRTFKKLLGRNGISALRFSLIDTQTFLYVSEVMVDISRWMPIWLDLLLRKTDGALILLKLPCYHKWN